MAKSIDAFRTIGEVSDDLRVPKHVLRFWENRFPQLKPMKRGGGRRYYRPEDVELLIGIHALLHGAGYTIKGVQRILRDDGVDAVKAAGRGETPPAASTAPQKSSTRAATKPTPSATPLAKAKNPAALTPETRAHLVAIAKELQACLALAKAPLKTAAPVSDAHAADEVPVAKAAPKKKRA